MKRIIILGIVIFLLAVLLKTPARLISSQLPKNSPVTLHGVTGSLWKGDAQQLLVNGVNLGTINWTVSALGLLTGGAKGDFTVKGKEFTASGQYKASVSKTLTLNDAQFTTTGRFINQFQKYGTLNGDFRGSIDYLEMAITEPLNPPVLSALINWEQGGLTSPIKLVEGNYQIKIESESEGELVAKITANDAPVDIKGNIVLDDKWQYQTDLKLKTTPKGQNLQGMMSMIGRVQPDGYFHIKEKGKLFK